MNGPEGVKTAGWEADLRAEPHVFEARSGIPKVTPPTPTLGGTFPARPGPSRGLRPARPEPQACRSRDSGLPCRSLWHALPESSQSPCEDSGLPLGSPWSLRGLRVVCEPRAGSRARSARRNRRVGAVGSASRVSRPGRPLGSAPVIEPSSKGAAEKSSTNGSIPGPSVGR